MKKSVFFFVIGMFFLNPSKAEPKTSMSDYSNVRIRELKIGSQAWTFRRFSFFETLDKLQTLGIRYLEAYPGQVLDETNPDVKFDHHLTDDQIRTIKQALDDHNIQLVNYGVVTFENDETSIRKVFDFARKMQIQTIVTEPQFDDFSLIEKMVKEYRIKVAIHNHPEPSKYARPETVMKSIEGLDRRIGACVDIGHWMRTDVDVIKGLRMLKGRILDVHFEDLDAAGSKEANTVPFGQGAIDIKSVLAELTLQNYAGILAIELEQNEVIDNPIPTIREGLEYVDSVTYYKGWKEILVQRNGEYNKQGWNHYGPGYFSLDRETGVLKSYGGMGLFWYSPKKFKNFILELDFKCSDLKSNSGVFLRVPEVPRSDDYIYHSFEVQINDAGKGIHKTAAVYDAEAPRADVSNPTGEWNHYKITFKGEIIQVELNGKEVLDWVAEPSGKVADFASEGYIGLQNHDWDTSVSFRNIFIKELE